MISTLQKQISTVNVNTSGIIRKRKWTRSAYWGETCSAKASRCQQQYAHCRNSTHPSAAMLSPKKTVAHLRLPERVEDARRERQEGDGMKSTMFSSSSTRFDFRIEWYMLWRATQ